MPVNGILSSCTDHNMDLRLLIVFVLSVLGVEAQCPDGWVYYKESCFFINKHNALSWAEASSDCKALLGGNLAVVDDLNTLNFLVDKINPTHQKPPNGACQVNEDYWIDGTDQIVEGHYIWASTLTPFENNFWCPGNPSNSNGVENCVEYKDGHWNDDDCNKKQNFICEIEYPGGQSIIG